MIFNEHSKLEGQHAFLSPSKYYWINYDAAQVEQAYINHLAVQRGVELHDLACRLIKNRIRLPDIKETFNMYVNDAIGYKMTPEQVLYYSDNCFGTCDSIAFRRNTLRIHDLKTGVTRASMHQLEIYAALFCLEYKKKPEQIKIELAIYQNNEIVGGSPDGGEIIRPIMKSIVEFNKKIEALKGGSYE